jgi:hypothetical protein
MLANVGVQNPDTEKAEILTFSTNLLGQDGSVPLLLRVKNISLNFFTAKPILSLTPLINFSEKTHEVTLEDKIIFPGQVRRWTEDTAIHNLKPNIYKAHIAVSTGNGQSIATEKYFIIFPFTKAFIIIGVLILILFLINKRRRLTEALAELYR